MTTNERRRPGRPRRADLSDRQREVLDLLVAGKTNPEIAEALGISLDGAKYHVREICDRAGVDTREEAAEWWRQERGLRARFALASAWQRIPRPVRWIGIAAGGATACVAVVAVLLFAFRDDEAGIEPGVWLAIVVPDSATAPGARENGRIHITRLGTDEDQTISEPGLWTSLAWSPDGQYLYAQKVERLDSDEPRQMLHIFDTAERSLQVSIEWTGDWNALEWGQWSPDGTVVALPADRSAGTLDVEGNLAVSEVSPKRDLMLYDSCCLAWAPDSSAYALSAESSLPEIAGDSEVIVVDRAGALVARGFGAAGWPSEMEDPGIGIHVQKIEWDGIASLIVELIARQPPAENLARWQVAAAINGSTVDATTVEQLDGPSGPVPALDPHERLIAAVRTENSLVRRAPSVDVIEFPAVTVVRGRPGGPSVIGQPIPADATVAFAVMVEGQVLEHDLGTWDERFSLGAMAGGPGFFDIVRIP